MFVNTYTQNYYSLVRWPLPKLLLFTLGTRTFVGRPLSPLTTQVASMTLGFVLTQALLISCSTRLSKLLYFQKAAAVVTIIDPTHIKDCEEQREGSICIRQIEYSSNHPLPTFPQSSVQKGGGGGGIFLGAYSMQIMCSRKCFIWSLLLRVYVLGFNPQPLCLQHEHFCG